MREAKKSNRVNIISWVSRLLLGLTFVFSGFVKAVDPLGTTYKIQDYFAAFGSFFEQFNSVALFLAVALFTLEFVIGFNLLFNFKIKLSSILALLFMLIMTPLTLYIALEDPVKDCGCFGDAIVLSNWATFGKNVVLFVLVIVLVVTLKKHRSIWRNAVEWVGVVIALLIPISISLYSYFHLPIIDFRPYKIGADIVRSMEVPEGAKSDVYETTFIYAKDGVEKEFTLANFPDENDGWIFIEQKTTLIEKGYEPPIHDFSIVNAMGDDITYEVLEKEGFTFFLIAYDVNKTEHKFNEKIASIHQLAQYGDIDFYAMTASVDEDIEKYSEVANTTDEWC